MTQEQEKRHANLVEILKDIDGYSSYSDEEFDQLIESIFDDVLLCAEDELRDYNGINNG